MNPARLACFDLEGPLTAEDYAYRLFADQIEGGDRIYAVLSRYDDVLTERCRVDYEPGDTLALALPFLVAHGITSGDIKRHAQGAVSILDGANATIRHCRQAGLSIHVITTSYAPFAEAVCESLGIPPPAVHSTHLPLDLWRTLSTSGSKGQIFEIEAAIRDRFDDEDDLAAGERDDEVVGLLDGFFLGSLPDIGGIHIGSVVRPVGGRRKAQTLEHIARELDVPLSTVAYVGDSITDVAAFRLLDSVGALGISFNGNRYALGAATVGVASDSLLAVLPVLEAWEAGGRRRVYEQALSPSSQDPGELVWLPGLSSEQLETIIAKHAGVRTDVRAAAGKLG